jgi:hypothetical protein
MQFLVSIVTVAFGIYMAIAPARAARVWGWKNLDHLSPTARTWYFRIYRAWGLLLCLAGILASNAR